MIILYRFLQNMLLIILLNTKIKNSINLYLLLKKLKEKSKFDKEEFIDLI